MTGIQNFTSKELVRYEITELFERGNVGVVDDLYAEDVVVGIRRTGSDEPVASREDIEDIYREWNTAFPDLNVDINSEVVEDDTVTAHVTLYGTHDGTFRGIEPTGNRISVDGFHQRRVRDGEIVEAVSMVEMGELLRQLDVELPLDA
ncbi:ester cyclase [Halomarina salina]|uniref:Ester cyclase n=1 Tax=Halomarina salina TaxID=1872699 RepID=A0ABD5RPA9_9EURY|nr:ester cyclase [Halomarina salina]